MKRIVILLTLMLTSIVSGCASVSDAVAAKGTGLTRTYNKDYTVVWDATINAVNETELSMVSEDQRTGVILAKTEWNPRSYGENVAIFVEAVPGQKSTKVEIVNKGAVVTELFVRDWDEIIAKRLDETLN